VDRWRGRDEIDSLILCSGSNGELLRDLEEQSIQSRKNVENEFTQRKMEESLEEGSHGKKVGEILVGELMKLDGVELGNNEAVTWKGDARED